jgi:drug/metabolite transporter (DMT)-like permease
VTATARSGTASSEVSSLLIVVCLAATWLVWGSTFLAIKWALVSFPPFFQMGTRFLVAGTLLITLARVRAQDMPTPRQWRNAAIVGTLMIGGNAGGVAYAEQSVASGLVVAFMAVTPALIALGRVPFGIRPSRLDVLGICLGIVGVLLLVRGNAFSASPAGLIAMLIATLGWAGGSILSQHGFPLAPAAAGYASGMICGGIVLMGLSLRGRHHRERRDGADTRTQVKQLRVRRSPPARAIISRRKRAPPPGAPRWRRTSGAGSGNLRGSARARRASPPRDGRRCRQRSTRRR